MRDEAIMESYKAAHSRLADLKKSIATLETIMKERGMVIPPSYPRFDEMVLYQGKGGSEKCDNFDLDHILSLLED